MHKDNLQAIFLRGMFLGLLACAVSCQTLRYRDVQHDFEQAVRNENEGSESPFVDWYGNVLNQLAPDAIAALDPRLRPNAWMLRAVSAWRSGEFELARASAKAGLREPDLRPHSRDDVILKMIDALVIDSELLLRFREAGRQVQADGYSEYEKDFKTALMSLDQAGNSIREPTPAGVRHYWQFHRWRILQNWGQVINAIDPAAVHAMQQANEGATRFLGQDPSSAAAAARDAIPADHPLRRTIRAREGAQ
jgi:hypothetical protein